MSPENKTDKLPRVLTLSRVALSRYRTRINVFCCINCVQNVLGGQEKNKSLKFNSQT